MYWCFYLCKSFLLLCISQTYLVSKDFLAFLSIYDSHACTNQFFYLGSRKLIKKGYRVYRINKRLWESFEPENNPERKEQY